MATAEKVKLVDSSGKKVVSVGTNGSVNALDVSLVDGDGNNIDEFNSSQYTTITTDDANGDIEYVGWAAPGSGDLTDEALWRIAKVTYTSGGNPIAKWADGVATFTKVFDDKLTYTYT